MDLQLDWPMSLTDYIMYVSDSTNQQKKSCWPKTTTSATLKTRNMTTSHYTAAWTRTVPVYAIVSREAFYQGWATGRPSNLGQTSEACLIKTDLRMRLRWKGLCRWSGSQTHKIISLIHTCSSLTLFVLCFTVRIRRRIVCLVRLSFILIWLVH